MSASVVFPAPHPAVWRATQAGPPPSRVLATGHPELAAHLPGRGWPYHCLIEFLTPRPGRSEASLLQPALAQVAGNAPILLVQPPHPPCAQGWLAPWPADARLWWLQPATLADTLWALNQAVRSGACAAVLAWLPEVTELALRRLHLAAQAAPTLLVVVRPWACRRQNSPAPLRLGLLPGKAGETEVHFLKMRGGRPVQPIVVAGGPGVAPVPAPASSTALPSPLAALAGGGPGALA